MSAPRRDVVIRPKRLPGPWKRGFALDDHTVCSRFVGFDEFGHETFDTRRTELGELLYRFKYHDDQSALAPLVATVAKFLQRIRFDPDYVVPTPPSRTRQRQPVLEIAKALGARVSRPVKSALRRVRTTPELKSVHEFSERIKLLENAFSLTREASALKGCRVLVLDDLWRSGATLNAVARLLVEQAQVEEVIAITITRTRSNR